MSTLISLGMRLIGVVVGIGTTAVLARTLAPSGYGTLSLALTLSTAATQIADLGIAVTVAAKVARSDEVTAGRILSSGLMLRTAIGLVATLGLLSAAAAGAFGSSSLVVAIAALSVPLSATAVLTAGAMARFRPEVSSGLALLQGVLWFAAVLTVQKTHASLTTLAWYFLGVTVLQILVGVGLNRRLVPLGRPTTREVRGILTMSWPLAVKALADAAYFRFDSVILFHVRGATELGYYSAAFKFFDVAQLGPGVLVTALLPLAAATSLADKIRSRGVLSLALRSAMVVGVGTAAALIATAPKLIAYLFGADFGPAVAPLVLLAIAFVGLSVGYVGAAICTAQGLVKPQAWLAWAVAVLSVGGQAVVAPRWGATGAAAVTAGTHVILGLGMLLLAAKAMRSPVPVMQLVCTLVVGAAAVSVVVLLDLPFVGGLLLVGVLFLAGLVALRVFTTDDLRRVLSRRPV
jgi:O-antigen/teichoic acid export membrane protein